MNIRHIAAPIVLGASLWASQAHAVVIDFDSHSPDFEQVLFDSGFVFDFSASGWGIFGPGSGGCCNVNYNGTTALFANGDRNGQVAQVTMTRWGGGAFDVSALDASTYWVGATGQLELIGTFAGGGTSSVTLSVGPDWNSYALPFSNVVSLTIRDTQSGFFLGAPGLGIDNIQTTPVPEPGTWALMLAGAAVLGAAARRRAA